MRKIQSPSGRFWAVDLFELPAGIGVRLKEGIIPAKVVLRFSSEDIILDLARFPDDWATKSDADLLALLRIATIPSFASLDDRPDEQAKDRITTR